MKTTSPHQPQSDLASILWSFRRSFITVGVFSAVSNLLMLAPSIYMLQVYDRYMMSQSDLTLIAVSLITLFLFSVMAFAEWSRSRLLVRLGIHLDGRLNSRVFNASFVSHLNQARDNPVQAFSDLTNVRQFITGTGIIAFFDLPWTPIYIIVVFLLHPWLGGVALLFSGVLATLAFINNRLTREPTRKSSDASSQASSYLHGKLRNAEVIESLGMLENLRKRWLCRHEFSLSTGSEVQILNKRLQALTKFIRYSQQSLMLGAGALLVINGDISVGAMFAGNILMSRALQPIDGIVSSWSALTSARQSYERLAALLHEHDQSPSGVTHPEPHGHIRIDNLVATAANRAAPILKGLSAEFPSGEITAIIGPSGSGKSTLARCLVGIWPEYQGNTLLDGQPLNSWNRDELGPHIGYLPQDIELLEGSIADNIARFRELAPPKVIEAAQRADVHELILRFANGYDTPVGVGGGLLSAGQRQRIALARAMYGNPALVVLDEPNSNLDDVGDAALLRAILDLKAQGKTVFVITHQKQILNEVDRILVLRDGEIQCYGTRQEVFALLSSPIPAAPMVAKPQPA